MNVLIASNEFIVRHVLGEALNWEYGIITRGDYTDVDMPFYLHFDVVIISLDFKMFNAHDVARYYRKYTPYAKIIGLNKPKEKTFSLNSYFDMIYEEPYSHFSAAEIVREINNNEKRRVANG